MAVGLQKTVYDWPPHPVLTQTIWWQPEVSNVASKRNSVTSYRFSHVFRAITIKSNNVLYEPTAVTMRRDNGFRKPRAITKKAITFLHSVEAFCEIMQICNVALSLLRWTSHVDDFLHIQVHVGWFYLSLLSPPPIPPTQACVAIVIKGDLLEAITVICDNNSY